MSAESPIDSAPLAASPPFRAKRAFLVFFAYFGVQLVVGFLAGAGVGIRFAVTHRGPMPEDVMRTATILGAIFGMLASAPVAYWLTRRLIGRTEAGNPLAVLGWSRSARRPIIIAVVAGALIGILYMLVAIALPPPNGARTGLLVNSIVGGGWRLYAWAILAVMIAPPVEEFIFRGVLWTRLSRSWGPFIAGLVVTALFVVAHLTEAWGYAPALFAIGTMAILALAMRIVSGSLVPPIVLHASYNAIIAAAVLGSHP